MKYELRIKNLKLLIFLSTIIYLLLFVPMAQAQKSVKVQAGVGKYYFSASGIVSPYASVVMTTTSIFMSSTVADSKGVFIFPRVLVNEGFKDFCMEAVDIRRIGNSYTCFEVDPLTSDYVQNDIFLPPTVGLSARRITPNSSILASGYSMPNADVDVAIGSGFLLQPKADSDGYYKVEISDLPRGSYELFATATYEEQESEKPSRGFKIESISFFANTPAWVWIFIFLLILILIIILLIILWKRRRKRKQSALKKKATRRRGIFFWRA